MSSIGLKKGAIRSSGRLPGNVFSKDQELVVWVKWRVDTRVMHPDEEWLIVDTETTGRNRPIHAVEIAAQRMLGWKRSGPVFEVLLDHDVPIEPDAERIHGYSRRHLRQHGRDPEEAHAEFRTYAGERPVVSYNLSFDWDQVLVPEYQRLGVRQSGTKGFCALCLCRRVVTETDNYRLETLKEHFSLSSKRSHRAVHDVESVVVLFESLIRKRLGSAGIVGLQAVSDFSRRTPVAKCRDQVRPG